MVQNPPAYLQDETMFAWLHEFRDFTAHGWPAVVFANDIGLCFSKSTLFACLCFCYYFIKSSNVFESSSPDGWTISTYSACFLQEYNCYALSTISLSGGQTQLRKPPYVFNEEFGREKMYDRTMYSQIYTLKRAATRQERRRDIQRILLLCKKVLGLSST